MSNILNDVSVLTSIPEKTLTKLNEKVLYSICEIIKEDVIAGKEISELDFGLFKVYVKHNEGEIKYKLIPSQATSKVIENTVNNKLNLLENTLNDVLAKKLLQVYKDIC